MSTNTDLHHKLFSICVWQPQISRQKLILWHHAMEIFSALPVLSEEQCSLVDSPHKELVMRNFDVCYTPEQVVKLMRPNVAYVRR